MQEVYRFICAHWETILSILLTIGSVVVFIIRKKPVNGILYELTKVCLTAVNAAELTGLKGLDKLNFAVEIVNKYIITIYPDLDINKYRSTIVSIIENILSTPQKKGEKK